MLKKVLVVIAIAALSVIVATPVAFAAYEGPSSSPNSGTTGTGVTWSPTGFTAGETVTARFCTQQILVDTEVAGQDGVVNFAFDIPAEADLGECTVTAEGQSSGRIVTTAFTVSSTTGWAYTGAQILFWILSGGALIALGVTLMRRYRLQS